MNKLDKYLEFLVAFVLTCTAIGIAFMMVMLCIFAFKSL